MPAEMKRHVYRIEVEGCVRYWASATSHEEALGLCIFTETGVAPWFGRPDVIKSEFSSGVDWSAFEVARLSQSEARSTPLHCEDIGETDMWSAHEKLDEPAVLGCSEWP